MEIEFFGGNCFKIKTKETVVVVDDNLVKVGGKGIVDDKTTALYTSLDLVDDSAKVKPKLMIDSPGEFEVGDLTITGLRARAHMDADDTETATVYQFTVKNQTVTVTGHIHPNISDDVADFIAGTDVLIVPVGGNGFTLDSVGAAKVIKKADPSVVIPSQYETKGLNFEVPAAPLDEFEKLPTVTIEGSQDSFKLSDIPSEEGAVAKVVVLNVKK